MGNEEGRLVNLSLEGIKEGFNIRNGSPSLKAPLTFDTKLEGLVYVTIENHDTSIHGRPGSVQSGRL